MNSKTGNSRFNTQAVQDAFQKQLRSDQYTLTHPTKNVPYTVVEIKHNVEVLTTVYDILNKKAREEETTARDYRAVQANLENNSPFIVDNVYEKQGGIYAVATKIVMEELETALSVCPEYQIPALSDPLRSVFSNGSILEIKLNPSFKVERTFIEGGKSEEIIQRTVSGETGLKYNSIRILAEQYAGTPEELASAVVAVRNILHYGDKRTGDSATRFWYNGLYLVAREARTVIKKRKGQSVPTRDKKEEQRRFFMYYDILRRRLEELGGKPAYWYLLNYGNASVDRMSASNKGGTGMPSNPPTHFVEKAENRIRKIILERNLKSTVPIQYGNFRKSPRYADLTKLIALHQELFKQYNDTARQIGKAKRYFEELLTNVTNTKPEAPTTTRGRADQPDLGPLPPPELPSTGDIKMDAALKQLDIAVTSILFERIRPMKIAKQLSNQEGAYVRAKLNQFIAEVASGRTPPARLYIISKDDVQLRLRTKSIVIQLQEEIDALKADTSEDIIEQIFTSMSSTLSTIQALRKAQNIANLVGARKGAK